MVNSCFEDSERKKTDQKLCLLEKTAQFLVVELMLKKQNVWFLSSTVSDDSSYKKSLLSDFNALLEGEKKS